MRLFWWLYFRIMMTLTSFLPDLTPILKLRGWLIRPCFQKCGKGLMITHNVHIGETTSVSLGENVYLAHGVWISGKGGVTIGNHVGIGPYSVIVSVDHMRNADGYQHDLIRSAPIAIDDGAWIGAHVVILRGVTIGRGSVVAAGAVVQRKIPDDCIAVGVPARAARLPALAGVNPTTNLEKTS